MEICLHGRVLRSAERGAFWELEGKSDGVVKTFVDDQIQIEGRFHGDLD